jgi:hypothetical protein
MADQTFDPQQAAASLSRMLGTAATTRNDLLQGFADDAQQEAVSLRKVRDALATAAGAADPAVQALDRRAAGTDQVTAFTRKTLEKIGVQGTSPPTGDWVVAGQVLDARNKPVAGATVTLTGDPDLAKRFGEVTSGKDGKFDVRFPGAEMKEVFARAPKVKLAVRSKSGKLHATTAEMVPRSDGIDLLEIRLGKPASPDPDDERPLAKKPGEDPPVKKAVKEIDERPPVEKPKAAGKKAS